MGDMDAFADLFERCRAELYALCLRRLGDPSLAEDAVQDVFIRTFTSLPNFDQRRPFWPWLATIAFRTCIDLQRRRSFTHYSEDIGLAMDADANNRGSEGEAGSALDAVIASEERVELWRSLKALPKRQRRVFLLYAVDGWSCADIAAAEGVSVAAVYRILFRARIKMRNAYQNGPPALVAIPLAWLQGKVQRTTDRVRVLLGLHGEGLSAACMQAACLGTAVMMVVAAESRPAESFGGDSLRSAEGVVSAAHSQLLQTTSLQATLPNIGAPPKAPGEPQQPVAGPASSLVNDVINPNQNATPENTRLGSITPSPNYESDHTVLAVGHSSSTYVLFVSRDGGGSWQPRPSRFLRGSTVVLPPGFPQDGRIFTFGGTFGLHQSDDGGGTFRLVSPMLGQGVAISPSFGKEDSKILLSGDSVYEYDAGTGVTRPALLTVPPTPWGLGYSSIAFSPSYQSDSTVFVADGSTLYSCRGLICDRVDFPQGPLRFPPQCYEEGRAYAFTPWKLLVSYDSTRTFEEIQFPLKFEGFSDARSISDVSILCSTSSDPAIFASANWISCDGPCSPISRSLSGIYRSFDAGRSWSRTWIDLPGFDLGASKLTVTPTGRLLAAGRRNGIACSVDRGETWHPRCPPEP